MLLALVMVTGLKQPARHRELAQGQRATLCHIPPLKHAAQTGATWDLFRSHKSSHSQDCTQPAAFEVAHVHKAFRVQDKEQLELGKAITGKT